MRTILCSIFSFSLLFISCGDSDEQTSSETTRETSESKPNSNLDTLEEIELISVISDLNVRSTAGKDGVVIDKLKFGQRAIFYGEETDYKEKIIMRNIPRFSTWKKIRFSGSGGKGATDGWVYGGGLIHKDSAYVQVNDTLYKREFTAITAEELEFFTGVEIEFEAYGSGYINYMLSSNNKRYVKNGSFKFTDDTSTELAGNFINDKLNGELIKSKKSKDYDYTCTLAYDKGICKKASISGIYFDQNISYGTSQPSECSFEFLERTLKN